MSITRGRILLKHILMSRNSISLFYQRIMNDKRSQLMQSLEWAVVSFGLIGKPQHYFYYTQCAVDFVNLCYQALSLF